jgi:hypothetical protein
MAGNAFLADHLKNVLPCGVEKIRSSLRIYEVFHRSRDRFWLEGKRQGHLFPSSRLSFLQIDSGRTLLWRRDR